MKRVLSIVLASLLIALSIAFIAPQRVSAQVTHRVVVRHRHKRSFWHKHRDKLTVAGSALAGAAIGGLAAGRKGAAIGTAVGAGSSALYTYKLRKRHRRHRRRY